jgi:tartrate-resistant acid phosphatase type 5
MHLSLPVSILVAVVTLVCWPSGTSAEPLVIDTGRADVRVAVIGDFGVDSPGEARVSAMVHREHPDLIATVGDNNYPDGSAATIDVNIGKFYHDFIAPYGGRFGAGAAENRFFPVLGNHDWHTPGAAPYLAFFTLPGNERYYSVRAGAMELFFIDSDNHEPDGIDRESRQAQWLQAALAASSARYRVVLFHHPPYSSGIKMSHATLQWPFREWGATAVLCGHDHDYERIDLAGMPYAVVGTGGGPLLRFDKTVAGSQLRVGGQFGALLIDADDSRATARFITTAGEVADSFDLPALGSLPAQVALLPSGSDWRYRTSETAPVSDWPAPAFDDSAWASGPAPLGFGEPALATAIPFSGTQPPVTSYFRTDTAPAPARLGWVELGLSADDSEIVYLNGNEVARFQSAAKKRGEPSAEPAAAHLQLDPAQLAVGSNLLAVEVHRDADAAISFDAELTGFALPQSLVANAAQWRYQDDGSALDSAWAEPGFDDSAWASGPAPLGYGEKGLATSIRTPDARPMSGATTYFRTRFTVADPTRLGELLLAANRQSGARVFLNGVEAARWNLPEGDVTAEEPPEAVMRDEAGPPLVEAPLSRAPLVAGENVLAVELHPRTSDRAGLRLDLSLAGTTAAP